MGKTSLNLVILLQFLGE